MSRDQIPRASDEDLARLRAGRDDEIDFSDMPERTEPGVQVRRDADGNSPKASESPLRDAIRKELGKRKINWARLHREAQAIKPDIDQRAVYEYLASHADISTDDAQALLETLDMKFVLGAKKKKNAAAKKPAQKKKSIATG